MDTEILNWGKLDNTAHLFPVIANKKTTNVFRESITLKNNIWGEILQKAAEETVNLFPGLKVSLKRGLFWYYLEQNNSKIPKVKIENDYPCRLINYPKNKGYLFRISYYKNRINLETFHALSDGLGAQVFLKELTYRYLALTRPELSKVPSGAIDGETSFSREDGFLKAFKDLDGNKNNYSTQKAFILNGRKFSSTTLGIIEGCFSLSETKELAKKKGCSLNEFLVSLYIYSIYLNNKSNRKPIICSCPVNLRSYFKTQTTKNFFTIANAVFVPTEKDSTLSEVITCVQQSLSLSLDKDNLQRTINYNVSNENNMLLRFAPLFFKNIAIYLTYRKAIKASTTTMSNFGLIKFKEPYDNFIQQYSGVLPSSTGQNKKAVVSSFKDNLTITFSSLLKDTSIEKTFFNYLCNNDILVRLTTNGVYDENL